MTAGADSGMRSDRAEQKAGKISGECRQQSGMKSEVLVFNASSSRRSGHEKPFGCGVTPCRFGITSRHPHFRAMSALPLIADIGGRPIDVRFVPTAAVSNRSKWHRYSITASDAGKQHWQYV